MVKMMANITKLDGQGRIVIPAEIRHQLKLEPDTEVELNLVGNDLVIKKVNSSLESDVRQWKEDLVRTKIPAGITITDEDEGDKWMDEDYVEKKLGLH